MHTTNVRRARVLVTLLTILALIAAACGGDETVTSDTGTAVSAVADSGEIEGEFLVSGSSTVFPIVLEQAEVFGAENSGVAIAVEGPGSGDGAKKFCDGEVPITNASRLLKDEEIEICEANGIAFIEIRRGIDGISVSPRPRTASTVFRSTNCTL
ncbi:MAG TPA: hypothetical protein DDY35_07655 [Acidimicrobiaceae bacterium]|nr:hypothetical protein [Acidimicrobiaceae bacterium]HBH76317.1 hypothetical protein [Acidimicrobiaceae bacterium]|tara:strand:+ start:245 stop:709 length:465 start_codon:yes stop_codon:yes gene_type:complete